MVRSYPALHIVVQTRVVGSPWQTATEVELDFSASFTRDPAICGGETVFRGTRVLLRAVLANLADGATVEEILADFPSLSAAQVQAAIAFAAASALDDMPLPAVAGSR